MYNSILYTCFFVYAVASCFADFICRTDWLTTYDRYNFFVDFLLGGSNEKN